MDIGKEQREIYIEPLKNPVPARELPPEKPPVKTPEKEKVKT
jgi:hypothetical protein